MNAEGKVLAEQRSDYLEVAHWSQEEDDNLIELNNKNPHDYEMFSKHLNGRSAG